MKKITDFFAHVFTDKKWLVFIALINFIGFFYGIYFYYDQLQSTPFYLWIFVLDSPLPVLLVSLLCIQKLFVNKMSALVACIAVFGLIKYGFWTVLVLAVHWPYFFAVSPLVYSLNVPLHALMVVEGMALLLSLKINKKYVAIPLVFYAINDFLDYFFSLLQSVPETPYLVYVAFSSTFLIALLVLVLKKHHRE